MKSSFSALQAPKNAIFKQARVRRATTLLYSPSFIDFVMGVDSMARKNLLFSHGFSNKLSVVEEMGLNDTT